VRWSLSKEEAMTIVVGWVVEFEIAITKPTNLDLAESRVEVVRRVEEGVLDYSNSVE
jgi:hypothetical protein